MSAVAACAVLARTRQQMATYGITADKLGQPGAPQAAERLAQVGRRILQDFSDSDRFAYPWQPSAIWPWARWLDSCLAGVQWSSKLADLSSISAFYSAGLLVSEKP